MLTEKQNLLETIQGGNPDRYVNQFRPFSLMFGTPYMAQRRKTPDENGETVDAWGITWTRPAGAPGPIPVHTPEKLVIPDMERWQDFVRFPRVEYTPEEWAPFVESAANIDRENCFATACVMPGVFEMCHHMMNMENCMVAFYEHPDEMHALIDALTDWELKNAEQICTYLKPDALFHHDDWGSATSTLLSPAMWRAFIKPAYKKIYAYYKAHGVSVIIHHNDAYSATLVPDMIDVGIDIWQGPVSSNDVAGLIEKYKGKLSFMGPIDSAAVDKPDWTPEEVEQAVREAVRKFGRKHVIYGATIGGPMSAVPGVYDCITDVIDRINAEEFGFDAEQKISG
ncbi:MAG: uroporphyrinogen decarboxylase [Clostridia bacterium]|nr:uroporphyrinogen decarboxylase [Clostridia bacterium]